MDVEKLRAGKRAMADRCRAVAEAIVKEAGVKRVVEIKPSQRAHAEVTAKAIYVQPPTTRRRLTTVAHECGHVALNHDRRHPSHRQEYEACKWGFEALRRHGIAVPRKEVEDGKRYVRQKIDQAIRRGAKRIDREAAKWCGYRLPSNITAVKHSPLPPKGGRYAGWSVKDKMRWGSVRMAMSLFRRCRRYGYGWTVKLGDGSYGYQVNGELCIHVPHEGRWDWRQAEDELRAQKWEETSILDDSAEAGERLMVSSCQQLVDLWRGGVVEDMSIGWTVRLHDRPGYGFILAGDFCLSAPRHGEWSWSQAADAMVETWKERREEARAAAVECGEKLDWWM